MTQKFYLSTNVHGNLICSRKKSGKTQQQNAAINGDNAEAMEYYKRMIKNMLLIYNSTTKYIQQQYATLKMNLVNRISSERKKMQNAYILNDSMYIKF